MSADRLFLQHKVKNLEESPEYQAISRVRVIVGEDERGNRIVYTAGSTSGRTIEVENPWGSQAIANNILAAVQGYAYKPYHADGAVMDPAAEIGDAVSIDEMYSVLADIETNFTSLMTSNIGASEDGSIDHEYPYESPANRQIAREIQGLKTSFIVENGRIAAEISDVRQTEQGLQNNITQLEMTVNGIHAYTDQEIQTISGGVVHDWAEVNFTPENIKSQVSSYFDEQGAADTAFDNAKTYTNNMVAPIAGQYTSAIDQSAKQIMATVAAAETIWDTSVLSQSVQNNIASYGYGEPSNSTASQYNGKYYLDQSSGTLYLSNGSKWTKQSTELQTIQTTTKSAITVQANRITSTIESVTALGRRVTEIAQTDSDITLSVYSNQNGTTYFKLSDGSGEIYSTEFNFTTDIVNVAGNLSAKSVAAGVSISSPNIYGGTFKSFNSRAILSLVDSDSGKPGLRLQGYDPYYGVSYNLFRVLAANSVNVWLLFGDPGDLMMAYDGSQVGNPRMVCMGTWDFRQASVLLPS